MKLHSVVRSDVRELLFWARITYLRNGGRINMSVVSIVAQWNGPIVLTGVVSCVTIGGAIRESQYGSS
jgi:hypothetical protein